MKVAVICANGKAGSLIVKEALKRGMDVSAFARGKINKSGAIKYVEKDLFDITIDDLKDFDAVVDAFGAWTEETLPMHLTSLKHLCDTLSGTKIRLLVVGGAGSLYMDAEHKIQLKDTEGFPDIFKPLANMQGAALDELRKRDDVQWTFISPSADFQADGAKSGKYVLGGEEFIVNAKGESKISYADYAVAMVDELENGKHIRQRISVIGE